MTCQSGNLLTRTYHLQDHIVKQCRRSHNKAICKPLLDQIKEGQVVVAQILNQVNFSHIEEHSEYHQSIAQYNAILEGAIVVLNLFGSLGSFNRMLQFRQFEQSLLQLAENLPPALELIENYPKLNPDSQEDFPLTLEFQVNTEGELISDPNNVSNITPEDESSSDHDEQELQTALQLHTHSPQQALKKFHELASYFPLACCYLGYYYYWGIATSRREERGLAYLQKAAQAYCPEAIDHIGTHYAIHGQHNLAILYYSQAAELNCSQACFHLYQCYQYGLGTQIDLQQAQYFLDRAQLLGYNLPLNLSTEVPFYLDI